MATWREVVYDIWTNLKQGFDDADVTLNQVTYWVRIVGAKLAKQHQVKIDSGASLQVFYEENILIDSVTGRQYIELPVEILDMDKDGGIEYISYSHCVDECSPAFTSVVFSRISPASSRLLYYTDDEKPVPSNPYFYRVGTRIYFLGIECINPCGIEIGLYPIMINECDFDDSFPLPEELLPILQRQVLDLGRFVLMMPKDTINEGVSDVTGNNVPTNKLVSVNDVGGMGDMQDAQRSGYTADVNGLGLTQ